jgi:hypothetical protein
MKNVTFVVAACCLIFLVGCCSSDSARKSMEQAPDSTTSVVSKKPAQPPAIVQNISRVNAVIEALTILDKTQYSLKIFIIKSEPFQGRFSLIEPEQRVTVYPDFVFTNNGGTVDAENPRNKGLLSLREALVGQSFVGKITIDRHGLWKLLEVESR